MSIEDNKSRNVYKPQMIIRLPDYPEYDHFTEIMSEIYDTVIAHDNEEMIRMVMGPREHLACIVVDAKRGIEYNFAMHKKMKDDMRFVSVPTIAVTLKHSRDDMLICINEGISDYIVLPEEDELVKLRVNNAIRSKDSATFAEIESMLKQLPSNIYLKDAMGRYVFATHYWHHLNDSEEQEWSIRGKTDIDIRKDKENARLAMESDQRIIQTGVGANYIIEEKSDEKTEYLEVIKSPIFDNSGNVNGIIGLINDVTEQQLLKMELEEKSKRDRLTGLYNKATCEDMIRASLLSAKENETMAILLIDTDRFKNINDTYGHTVGDKVLGQIGSVISDVFKGMDICGRFGGDEFLVLMKNVNSRDDAATLGKELICFLKERIKNEVYAKDVSLSIGVALYPEHGKTLSEILSAADEALYYVKDHGRDGIYIYQSK